MTTTAGPGGGAALGWGTSVAPPPICSPVEPAGAAPSGSGEHSELPVDAGYCVRLPALIATLSSPDREIVLLRVVAGFSAKEVGLMMGKRPGTVRVLQHRALANLARDLVREPVTRWDSRAI